MMENYTKFFFLTGMIFACFSGAALFAPDGQYLYLGGTLLSGLSTMFWLGLLNLFFQSQLIFQVCHSFDFSRLHTRYLPLGRSQTTLSRFWLFLTTYPTPLTFFTF